MYAFQNVNFTPSPSKRRIDDYRKLFGIGLTPYEKNLLIREFAKGSFDSHSEVKKSQS